MLVSFLSVVVLLFFAGLVSLFELRRVSSDTEEILRASERNLGLAKDMLDAAARQNKRRRAQHRVPAARLRYGAHGQHRRNGPHVGGRPSGGGRAGLSRHAFGVGGHERSALRRSSCVLQAQRMASEASGRLSCAGGRDSLSMKSVEMDFDGARWYAEAYSKAYDKLTGSIKNYMISTQSSLAPRTEQLKRNAYRAVTPVLISLLVMIAIVLMLYYFVSAYLVRPVLAMNKSLGDYLRFGLPFRIKAEVKDEVAELKDRIDDVIQLARKTKPEQR